MMQPRHEKGCWEMVLYMISFSVLNVVTYLQPGESQTFCEDCLIYVLCNAAKYRRRIFYKERVCLEKRFHLLGSN